MSIQAMPDMLQHEIRKLELEIISGQLSTLTIESTIFDGIKRSQELDPLWIKLKNDVLEKRNAEFSLSPNVILHFKGRLCIPDDS